MLLESTLARTRLCLVPRGGTTDLEPEVSNQKYKHNKILKD